MPNKYEWKRFWCPRGGRIQITEHGYLVDPASELGRYANPGLVTLDDLLERPCVVLLGEAGSGKSTELGELRTRAVGDGQMHVSVDAGEYPDLDGFRRDLFGADAVCTCRRDGGHLTILLDALDEALLETPRVIGLLERELRKLPIEKLRFRVACRTGAWPESLSESLVTLFGKENAGLYELAPLQRADIETAAEAEGIVALDFIDAVEKCGAGPLAVSPVTLRFLLDLYGAHGELPASLKELYEGGLIALCSPSQERRDRAPVGFTPPQLLQAASRCAAATLLTRKAAIFTGPMPHCTDADVAESVLIGDTEQDQGQPFPMTQETIRLVFAETGLFTARGPSRLGFTHKTYGEFLAARYLFRLQLPEKQLATLLLVPDEASPRIIPQLHEVAAWLASFDDDVFALIADSEPEVLLLSDVATRDADTKARLVGALLQRVSDRQLTWTHLRKIRGHLDRLRHPGLANQLLAHITGTEELADPRRLAIEIVDKAGVEELADALVQVALNPEDEYIVRDTAAHAVVNLETPEACARLKLLALGEAGDDPTDQLRGCGLLATWPSALSAEELFRALTVPKKSNFIGSYQTFLASRDLADEIAEEDLVLGIEWACTLRVMSPRPPGRSSSGFMSTRSSPATSSART